MRKRKIRLDKIEPPSYDARFGRDPEKIRELAASMASIGLLQPVAVVATEDGWRLIAGKSRYEAAKALGWEKIDAVEHDMDVPTERAATIAENLQRQDLNAVEEAVAFGSYLEETGGTQEELADLLGMSRSYVSKRLLLLDLDETTLQAVYEGHISWTHALQLRRIEDPERRRYFLNLAAKHGVAVSVLQGWVNDALTQPVEAAEPHPAEADDYEPPPAERWIPECAVCGQDGDHVVLRTIWICRADAEGLEAVAGELQALSRGSAPHTGI